jgi:tetratricopeptide (TPR) repeat protein
LAIQQLDSQRPPSWLAKLVTLIVSLPLRAVALFYAFQGQYLKAVHLDERLLCLQPRSRGLLMHLAASLTRAGLDEAALATYEELVGFAPNYLPGLRQLARLAMKHGNDHKARQCFQQILTLAPSDLEAQQGVRNLDALGTLKKGFAA